MSERPPELLDLPGLEARVKAWAERANAEYTEAEREYTRLRDLHCHDARVAMDRWGEESGRALRLLSLLQASRSRARTEAELK